MTEIQMIEHVFEVFMPYVRERHANRENLQISAKNHATDLLTEVDLEVLGKTYTVTPATLATIREQYAKATDEQPRFGAGQTSNPGD